MRRVALEALLFAALVAGAVAVREWFPALPPEPPPAVEEAAVLRRLELRIVDLDKTHPVVGGERYRPYECREVRR